MRAPLPPGRASARPLAVLAAVLGSLPIASCLCGDGGGHGEADEYLELEYELFPTTKPLEEAELAALVAVSADGTVFEFAAPVPERVAGLARRDVIVGGLSPHTPRGFLRAVHHTEAIPGGGLRVHTVETSLPYAFRQFHLRMRQSIEVGGEPAPAAPGTLRQPLSLELPIPFDATVFDGDGDPATKDDRIAIDGELRPRVRFDLDIDVDWPDSVWDVLVPIDPLDPLDLPAGLEVSARLETSAGAAARLRAHGVAGREFVKDLDLGEIPLGTIPAPAPFVVVVVNLHLKARISGSTSASFETGLEGDTGDFGFAVTVDTEDGESGLKVVEPKPSFHVDTPVIDSRARAEIRIGPRISALIWDVVGPQVGLAAVATLEADNRQTPCWNLDAGFDAEVGLRLRPFLDEAWPIPLVRTHVADGGCLLPPDAGTDVFPGFTPWARAYADHGFSGGEWTDLTLGTDGRYLIAADTGRALAKVTAGGDLVWSKEYDRIEPVSELRVPLYVQHVEPTGAADLIAAAHPPTFVSLDLAGNVRWARKASLVQHGSMTLNGGIVELADGTFLAASVFEPFDGADDDLVLLRIRPDGELIDARTWGDDQRDQIPTSIARWGDGWVVTGRSRAPMPVSQPAWALELDAAGTPVRAHVFEGGDRRVTLDAAHALADGGLLLGGSVARPGGMAALLLKLREDRTVAWQRAIDSGGGAGGFGLRLTAVTQTPFGYLLAAGTLDDYFSDTWVAALDAAGFVDWGRVVDAAGKDVLAPALAATEDHGVLVAMQQEFTEPAGYALMKVWRKDGRVDFRDGVGVTGRDLSVTETDPALVVTSPGIETEPVSPAWEAVELRVEAPAEAAQLELSP